MLIRIRLFGVLSQNQKYVEVNVGDEISLHDFKTLIAASLPDNIKQNVLESAIAVNNNLLSEIEKIHLKSTDTIALLPPVCGG